MIKTIRKHLLEDKTINDFVNQDGVKDALFYEFKPKINATNYIILKDKPLDIGHIERYQLDVLIYGKDLMDIIEVEKALRKRLNDIRGTYVLVGDDCIIRDMTMLTGGGRQFNEDKDRFISVQYFRITI